jgi:hypothetical protein
MGWMDPGTLLTYLSLLFRSVDLDWILDLFVSLITTTNYNTSSTVKTA